jgi:dipeptidyl aminopeptidase/acylaminoacyl peptidase
MSTPVEARTDLRRFLNVRTAYGPSFTSDGERLAYLTNVTGVPQVWSVPVTGGWPEQHTFHDEAVRDVRCDPTTDRWLYAIDTGGNERTQLRLLVEGGSVEVALTDAPDVIHHPGPFTPDGSALAYAANDRDPACFDVFIRPLGPRGEGKPRRLVRSSGMWLPAAFTPDGKSLVVVEFRGNMDQDLHLVDVESGDRRLLTPRDTEGPVRHTSPVFSPDGKSLFLLSDRDDDFLRLWRVRLEDETWQVVDAGGWDVEALVGSDRGQFIVYARNVDGASELCAIDLEAEKEHVLEDLPTGSLTGIALSPEGRRVAVSVTADDRPGDAYVLALPDGAPRQVTFSSRAGIPEDALVPAERTTFPSFDDRKIPGLLYRPTGIARPPCVVWVHGGPESQFRPGFNPSVQYFVNHGYAVFAPNVRGSTGYGKGFAALDDVRLRPDSVADLGACAKWLKSRDDVDGDRLAVMGGSYGGFMVLSTLTEHPDLWAAGVDIVGIANLVTFLENTGAWRRKLREVEYGSLESDRDFLEQISPIHKVDRITAPLMVVHGANDPRVPVDEAEQIVAGLKKLGRPVEYLRYEDEGHGIVKLANRLTAYPAVVDFLDRHLKGA